MNPNTDPTQRDPLPRWVPWAAAAVIFTGLGLLEAMDAHVERAIAEADADAARAVAMVVQQYGIECGTPAQPPAIVAEAR